MTRDETGSELNGVLERIPRTFAVDIAEDHSLTSDLGLHPLSMVELVAAEDRFAIRVSDGEMRRWRTVGDVIDFVLAHQPHTIGR